MPAEIIALANQKGGVTKTTTTVALWAILNGRGLPTLLVDADHQCSATLAAGFDVRHPYASLYDHMEPFVRRVRLPDPRSGPWDVEAAYQGWPLLPAHADLALINTDLAGVVNRERVLAQVLTPHLRAAYAYILIDAPPQLDWMLFNILTAADRVLIPTIPDFISAQGLPALGKTIALVQRQLNPTLAVAGVVLARVAQPPRNEQKTAIADIRAFCADVGWPVAPLFIPDSIKAAEAARAGVPVPVYAESNGVGAAYYALADWLVGRAD